MCYIFWQFSIWPTGLNVPFFFSSGDYFSHSIRIFNLQPMPNAHRGYVFYVHRCFVGVMPEEEVCLAMCRAWHQEKNE